MDIKFETLFSSVPDSFLGFNGDRKDLALNSYHLGNGYRFYHPGLRRFVSPDSLSPFNNGGINAYTYCAGDPVNNIDPTGHISTTYNITEGILTSSMISAGLGYVISGALIFRNNGRSLKSLSRIVLGSTDIAAGILGIIGTALKNNDNNIFANVLVWTGNILQLITTSSLLGIMAYEIHLGREIDIKGGNDLKEVLQQLTQSIIRIEKIMGKIADNTNIPIQERSAQRMRIAPTQESSIDKPLNRQRASSQSESQRNIIHQNAVEPFPHRKPLPNYSTLVSKGRIKPIVYV